MFGSIVFGVLRKKRNRGALVPSEGRFFLIIRTLHICDQNLGAEDYLNISQICNHIFIEKVPVFNEYNSNQQLRFITLIDILYEKKISLTLSMESSLSRIGTSKKHSEIFKRTTSRLYEMTMSKYS